MGDHLVEVDGVLTFHSDKYPTCPAGKVPLSVKDKDAQPLLWKYSELHWERDQEFSRDLQTALRNAGYVPRREQHLALDHHRGDCAIFIGSHPEPGDCTCGLTEFRQKKSHQ